MATLPEPSNLADNIPQWASGCPTCKDIWHQFADPESAPEVHLGSHEEALLTTCPNHKVLVQRFINYVLSRTPQSHNPNSGDISIGIPGKGYSTTISESVSQGGYLWNLLLVKKYHVPNHPGIGRLLDPDWADVEIIKKWKHKCVFSHGAKCENPLKVWPSRPAWLVDVQKQCIIPGHTRGNYVAISYTYGNHTQPKITSSDFIELQEPFALETTKFSSCVSPIIRHAMYLTSLIDERYLWADALCITHHDPEAASEQLKSMGAIYANAVVTIVATDGDSESGLPGLKGVSNPRGTSQEIIPFGDERLVVRNTDSLDEMIFFPSRPEPYYKRGWTFQEYALAKRKIIFNKLELHWICSCSVWHEELTLHSEIDDEVNSHSNLVMAGFPDDSSLRRYLDAYNQRSLTFEEDALPAVSGLLSVFSRSFEGGFLYGLPEMFFEHSLGWRPLAGSDLQRRIPSGRPIEKRFASSDLPSWSWLGWKGSIDTRCQTAIRVDSNYVDGEAFIEEAFPITEWYTSGLPTDSPERRRRIRSTWFEKRDCYKDFTKPMPSGWTRAAVTPSSPHDESPLYPDGCDRYIFKHEAMLERNGRPLEWYYPFPVVEILESTPPFVPEQTQYLFCETFQARLTGYQQDPDKLRYEWDLEAKLCDTSGKDIGNLHLLSKDSSDRFPKDVNASKIGLPVDVVAVCKLKTCSKTWNREKWVSEYPLIKKETYLVLWVEWKDGVAYRLASGEVLAAEWERLDVEKVSLILG